jgi:hypothetical protein
MINGFDLDEEEEEAKNSSMRFLLNQNPEKGQF